MHPAKLREHYSDYMEGRLDEASRRRFERALDEHPELRDDYELFVRTQRLVTGIIPEPAEPGFEAKVLARLAAGRKRKTAPLLSMRWMATSALAAAAAFAFTAILVIFATRGGERPGLPVGGPATAPPAQPEMVAREQTMPREETVPLTEPEIFGDPVVASQVQEIATLIEEINKLSEQFRQQEDEVLLHASRDKGVILRPSNLYRQATLASARKGRRGDDVVHAY